MADPQPSDLDHCLAQPRIAGFANALVAVEAAALPRRRGQPGVGGNLAPVAEVPEQGFQPEDRGKLRPDTLEGQESRGGFRHSRSGLRHRLGTNQGVALGFDGLKVCHDAIKTRELSADLLFQP